MDTGQSDQPQGTATATSNPVADDFVDAFMAVYRDATYFSSGREWTDYAPAYGLGRDLYERHPLARFEDLDAGLESNWEAVRATSRLAWVEARGAVEHAWVHARAVAPHPPTSTESDAAQRVRAESSEDNQ